VLKRAAYVERHNQCIKEGQTGGFRSRRGGEVALPELDWGSGDSPYVRGPPLGVLVDSRFPRHLSHLSPGDPKSPTLPGLR